MAPRTTTETTMTNNTILSTENEAWGFWGTMGERAAAAWPIAFAAIHDATGTDPDSVRAFLDSRHGRHFADEVSNHLHAGATLPDAIARATATWMGWRIGRRTSRETGIPAGLPYLTGFVISEGIAADAARED
jgi:hypothetical protein